MEIVVDIEQNLNQLLESEDTDSDKKITVDDKGPKRFSLKSVDGKNYEICSTYNLAVLLQELYLAKLEGKKRLRLSTQTIFQQPVERISSQIKNSFWDGLTRSIDEDNIDNALKDTKSSTDKNYIYVPFKDEQAFKYYKKLESKRRDLNISIIKLPKKLTDEYLQSISGKPGLLVLALEKNKSNKIKGIPFVVPGGRFNEMYGWDSYFESLGLIQDGKIELAMSMAENFFYEIEHYGKILNAK